MSLPIKDAHYSQNNHPLNLVQMIAKLLQWFKYNYINDNSEEKEMHTNVFYKTMYHVLTLTNTVILNMINIITMWISNFHIIFCWKSLLNFMHIDKWYVPSKFNQFKKKPLNIYLFHKKMCHDTFVKLFNRLFSIMYDWFIGSKCHFS